jgi:DNA-binding MarR family transcriptional regulator
MMRDGEGELLTLLTETQAAMSRLFTQRVRHLGLTRPQWRVLTGLYRHDGLTQSQLSDLTLIARSPLGKIVDQLEQLGYVERLGDPDDRRINRLHATDAVEPVMNPARKVVSELEHLVLDGLPARDDLVHQLILLKANLLALIERESQVT